MIKKKKMSLDVKKRVTTIDDAAVASFAAQAETERNKTPQKKDIANEADSSAKAGKKVVRDSFTMPEEDYALIAEIRLSCMKQGILMNKGEVLRAGLHALMALSDEQLGKVAATVEKVKTGRPKA